MREQVGRAPQQPDPGPPHVAFDLVDDRRQVRGRLGERGALRCDVTVVEREERHAELVDELERGRDLRPCGRQRIAGGAQPRPVERPGPEHVRARPVERVPQAYGDAEVVRHPLAEDEPVGLVDRVGQRVGRADAAKADAAGNVREEVVCHRVSFLDLAAVCGSAAQLELGQLLAA